MRTLVIERDLTVREIDAAPAEWRGDDDWDAARIDDRHYAWIKDDALFAPGAVIVDIGAARRMALPAYILGFQGERSVSATLTVDDLRKLVT